MPWRDHYVCVCVALTGVCVTSVPDKTLHAVHIDLNACGFIVA